MCLRNHPYTEAVIGKTRMFGVRRSRTNRECLVHLMRRHVRSTWTAILSGQTLPQGGGSMLDASMLLIMVTAFLFSFALIYYLDKLK